MFEDDRTEGRPRSNLVSYQKFRVLVENGPDSGQERFIVNQTLRVGSSSESDLVLSDQFVSRQHCAIEPVSDGLRIRDEASRNGVVVDGIRILDAVVGGAVRIRLGDTVLLVEPLADREEREQVPDTRFGDLLGQSVRMRELFADLGRIARADVTLLIEGETGTGKELVAESVHGASSRAQGPFVIFDCGAVAPTLAESELFGHEKGAFTGAISAAPGVFEQADRGTLFLDELGELPKDLQPKLLRALESKTVKRLGSQKTIRVDVRVIAATNRNLEAEVRRGNFREDLYYRLETAHVYVPPLRDRMADLPLLAAHFLSRASPPRTLDDIAPELWAMFQAHRWPGNVRELANALQRLLITPDRVLRAPQSPEPPVDRDSSVSSEVAPLRLARREASDVFERSYLERLLRQAGGNVHRAAAIAEVSRQMIQRMLRRHGMG